jgi:transcriptional antiterminator Rof (Rho-off)
MVYLELVHLFVDLSVLLIIRSGARFYAMVNGTSDRAFEEIRIRQNGARRYFTRGC